jgi:hypothetical protein
MCGVALVKDIAHMNKQNDKRKDKKARGSYEKPKVVRVSLRPEEAVLGHCKIAGSAGAVAASCRSVVVCRTLGS